MGVALRPLLPARRVDLFPQRIGGRGKSPDYLPALQQELIAVISKYVKIRPEDIQVNLEHQDNIDLLSVKIELADGLKG